MDTIRIDTLVRTFSGGSSRRGVLAGLAAPADPITTADASCAAAGFMSGLTGIAGVAQTFVAWRSGQLTSASVKLMINAEGNDFVMEIRSVDAAGKPGGVLASTAINDVPKTSFDQPPRTITGTFAPPASDG